jgi:hypothetical protein
MCQSRLNEFSIYDSVRGNSDNSDRGVGALPLLTVGSSSEV